MSNNYHQSISLQNGIGIVGGGGLTHSQINDEFYPRSNPSGYALAIEAGGVTSLNGISGLLTIQGLGSNAVTVNGSNIRVSGSEANLVATGVNLQGQIDTLTTSIFDTGTNANTLFGTLSGNLELSGVDLKTKIDVERNKQTVSGISISGGNSLTGLISISGTGNLLLRVSNQVLYIDGTLLGTNLVASGQDLLGQIVTEKNKQTITGYSVTGSNSLTGLLKIAAGSNILYILSGNEITIASSGGGNVNVAVTGLSITGGTSITGKLHVSGFGLVTVIQEGNTLKISGAGADSAGENNTASNVGTGVGIFAQKSVFDLQFYSLMSGTGIIANRIGNEIYINSSLNTGQFATVTQVNIITGSTGALNTNLELSGIDLKAQIDTERNKQSVTGISVSGGVTITGLFHILPGTNMGINVSGNSIQFFGNTFASTTQLFHTGANLATGVSGLTTNLQTTGVSLTNRITGLNVIGWNRINATGYMSMQSGYLVTGTGLIALTLPSGAIFGQELKIAAQTPTGLFRISQQSGQSISMGYVSSSVGSAGYAVSTGPRDYISIMCVRDNFDFQVIGSHGNIDFN